MTSSEFDSDPTYSGIARKYIQRLFLLFAKAIVAVGAATLLAILVSAALLFALTPVVVFVLWWFVGFEVATVFGIAMVFFALLLDDDGS